MDAYVEAIEEAGRTVTSVQMVDDPKVTTRFEQAREALAKSCGCAVRVVEPLFHSTSADVGRIVCESGFKVGPNANAFGKGVNLSPKILHTLLYLYDHHEACTLVCAAAIGKTHENESRRIPGQEYTVPDHVCPKVGYDAMTGMGGMILVVPSAARVRPIAAIYHRAVLPKLPSSPVKQGGMAGFGYQAPAKPPSSGTSHDGKMRARTNDMIQGTEPRNAHSPSSYTSGTGTGPQPTNDGRRGIHYGGSKKPAAKKPAAKKPAAKKPAAKKPAAKKPAAKKPAAKKPAAKK